MKHQNCSRTLAHFEDNKEYSNGTVNHSSSESCITTMGHSRLYNDTDNEFSEQCRRFRRGQHENQTHNTAHNKFTFEITQLSSCHHCRHEKEEDGNSCEQDNAGSVFKRYPSHYEHGQHNHHQYHQRQHHYHRNHPLRPVFALFVLLVCASTPVFGVYEICKNTDTNEFQPCQSSTGDAINSQFLKIKLDPSDATCGTPPSEYQRLGDRDNKVSTCDATSTTGNQHPLSFAVDSDTTSWWQSVSQTEDTTELNINVTLSFNKLYQFSGDLVITFNSGRPEKMILEKSVDYGTTWTPLQFFARRCADFKDQVDESATVTKEEPATVICTNRYMELFSEPFPGGKVKLALSDRFNLLLGPLRIDYKSYYEALEGKMLDFLIFSDIRIRLIAPASNSRRNFKEYYYAIQDIEAQSRCFCNLHGSVCSVRDSKMMCDCKHNTQGINCEECLPLYNNQPWKRGSFLPYSSGSANECKKCECNDHAESCTYDADYGKGICNNCTHNTKGKHCEECSESFYPNTTASLNDEQRCLACECQLLGVEGGNLVCAQTAAIPKPIGQCPCKALVTGRKCDDCVPGHYGLLEEPNLGSCTACECDLDGTQGQSNTCAQNGGQCPCKTSTTGRQCNTCADQYFLFPKGKPQEGCKACACNKGGSTSLTCDKVSGNCTCKAGIDGDKCDRSAAGSYVPAIDNMGLEPVSGGCQVTSDLFTDAAPFDKTGFAKCDITTVPLTLSFEIIKGGMIQAGLQWPYHVAVRYTNKNTETITGKITLSYQGNTEMPLSPLASRLGTVITPGCPGGVVMERDVSLVKGTSTAILLTSNPVVMDARCKFSVTLTLNPPQANNSRKKRQANVKSVNVDSISFLPALANADKSKTLNLYSSAADKAAVQQEYQDCLKKVAVLRTRNSAMAQAPCDEMLFAVVTDIYNGGADCSCNADGSMFPKQCASLGGQCTCKTGVSGRACDTCLPGHFNFTSEGCDACNCYAKGSKNGACDLTTGQCPCLPNVLTLDKAVEDKEAGQTCRKCLLNFYGIDSGTGCSACSCNDFGSTSLQCDRNGQCPCKDSVEGVKCDTCKAGFYGFGADGCSPCNCSAAGSTSIKCDQTTGVCSCKDNVQGNKCSECKPQMFNLATYNPKGCQPCFCFDHSQQCTSAEGFEANSIRLTGPPITFNTIFGQRHTSYGTQLSLGLSADFTLIIEKEKVLTFEGNGKKMYHMAKSGTTISRDATLAYKIQILEDEWKKEDNGQAVAITAKEMMGILASLSTISHITKSKGQDVRLVLFEMEIPKENANAANPLTSVEKCVCNAASNVGGLSCQDCATGFKRPNANTSTNYDSCIACDCNTRGVTTPPECNQLTGVCLNCRNGTTGDQCESCANNVTGSECDTCVDGYWGLNQDGCSPCECSSPGSQSTTCDKVSGQCTCAPNIAGRTCDKCAENFHNLTAEGCIECDQCYGLLKGSVGDLRTIQGVLSQNVSLIEERSNSTNMTKPFTVRFKQTEEDTNKLISFLKSAEASENEVKTQIVAFNSSLLTVESQLTTIDNVTLPEIETNLASGDKEIDKATQYRTSLEAGAKDATSKIAKAEEKSQMLSAFANDLKEVKDALQALADASSADREILNHLSTLNITVETANQKAKDILVKAQGALEIQKNTTGKILSLESSVIGLLNKATQISSSASSLATQSKETSASIAKLETNLAALKAYVIDFGALKSRIATALAVTDAQKSQLASDLLAFETIKTQAAATVADVNELTTQSRIIGTNATDWISRSIKAEEQVQLIQQRAKNIFNETEATLNLLQNFETKATEVEKEANEKLTQVATVQAQSKKLIEDSKTLTDSLSSLQITASNAKEASEQSKQVIQTKLTQIEGVERKSNELKAQLQDIDPGGNKRLGIIDTAKTNVLQVGDKLCSDINEKQLSFNSELATTDKETTDTLEKLGNVTERANTILTQLRGLEKVDAAGAQTLFEQIETSRSNLKLEDLTATINGLLASKASQRAEIDRLKAVKLTLKQKVDNLKLLVQQIRPATST